MTTPRLTPDPAGGQVMITRFECPNVLAMLVVLVLHVRIQRDVRKFATGFIAVVSHHSWRTRTLLSISLWRDLDSVYSMGEVKRHIQASRIPRRLGVVTRCGVFCYTGDWRHVMFGVPASSASPLAYDVSDTATASPPVVAVIPATIT